MPRPTLGKHYCHNLVETSGFFSIFFKICSLFWCIGFRFSNYSKPNFVDSCAVRSGSWVSVYVVPTFRIKPFWGESCFGLSTHLWFLWTSLQNPFLRWTSSFLCKISDTVLQHRFNVMGPVYLLKHLIEFLQFFCVFTAELVLIGYLFSYVLISLHGCSVL